MAKYRKKPIVIDAVQYTGGNWQEVFEFCKCSLGGFVGLNGGEFIINTLEGQHIASVGDYIIKGVAGEFYPCKPSIFADIYEDA